MRASLIAILVFAADRVSKFFIETRFEPYENRVVIPGFFDLIRSQNPGVAFGLFANITSPYRTGLLIAFSLGALLFLGGLLWRNRTSDAYSGAAIALIGGGAAGNVFDRIRLGSVTDFLDFYHGTYHWYTFNLADTAISIGAALLFLRMMRQRAPERKAIP